MSRTRRREITTTTTMYIAVFEILSRMNSILKNQNIVILNEMSSGHHSPTAQINFIVAEARGEPVLLLVVAITHFSTVKYFLHELLL
mmetsp:Transcript_6196/g.11716  ORF Transcript_6196/g.11716 Transcript_6196/m.11716 type:complete len:87 (+) Transcript_6196:269-529(+)